MSWIQENKFLAAFGGFMLVGAGALGYLTMDAGGAYEKAAKNYEEKASELTRLHGLKPYPSEENLKAYKAQEKELKDKIDALHKDLAANQIKQEPSSATAFQDKLKETVTRVLAKAHEVGLHLPDKFYMGFEQYQSTPPKDVAASALAWELRAMTLVMDLLLEVKDVEVTGMSRGELKEEKKLPAADPKDKGKKGDEEKKKLVQKSDFQVKFKTSQDRFQKVLNEIVGNKQQFYIVRNLSVKNEKDKPPSKVVVAPAAPPAPAPGTPTPAAPAAPAAAPAATPGTNLESIFGTEKVEVTLDIDIVQFAEPKAEGLEKGSKQPK
jgi:hypothetical protein